VAVRRCSIRVLRALSAQSGGAAQPPPTAVVDASRERSRNLRHRRHGVGPDDVARRDLLYEKNRMA